MTTEERRSVPFPIADIVGRLDLDHINELARAAALDLQYQGFARVELTPNDCTIYRIIVLAPGNWITAEGRESRGGYMVTLVGLGDSYIWHGGKSHYDYVTDKWAKDHRWTGVVMTEFLNALSEALAS